MASELEVVMENEWLFMWLVAPIFSPAAMAIEAYSLLWYVQDMRPAERRPSGLIAIQSRPR
jgi:hypothetical protein